MGKIKFFILIFVLTIFCQPALASEPEIISLYKGSKMIFDDDIGFETHYYLAEKDVVKEVEGKMIRKFCSAPEGVSPFEIVKNYEKAIASKGGEVIHLSREAYRHTDKNTGERVLFMRELFSNGRKTRYNPYGYMQLPRNAEDYVAGKISSGGFDYYISVASAVVEDVTYYTLVTVKSEPMDMNNVTLNILNDGIAANGRVAIYDIYFDTGKYNLKPDSSKALKTIASYLKKNTENNYFIVGHTDNTGSYDANIKLSVNRAEAVKKALVTNYDVKESRLKSFGAGPVSPVTSNKTEDGRARNRRVELVER
jgi:outer membrane protein OmpA-like peptidoglycan-associated protein